MSVKFLSVNLAERTATFDVDGERITRGIADNIDDENLKEHLLALARGLAIEYPGTVELSDASPFAAGEELA